MRGSLKKAEVSPQPPQGKTWVLGRTQELWEAAEGRLCEEAVKKDVLRPELCGEWGLEGLHRLFAGLVRWGCFCITSFFILRSHPPHTGPSLFLSLSLCPSPFLVMLIAPKVRASAALAWTPPHPSPGFEWHVLIRPNLIGRHCLGWIGTTLYSPLLSDVCGCVCVSGWCMSGYEVSVDECMRVLHVSREVFFEGCQCV